MIQNHHQFLYTDIFARGWFAVYLFLQNSNGSCDIDSSSGQSMASCSNNLSYGAPNYLSGAGMPLNEKTLNVYNKPLQPPARINGQRQLEAGLCPLKWTKSGPTSLRN